MKVFVAIYEDRHCDVEVEVFAEEVDAVKVATDYVESLGRDVMDEVCENDALPRPP